jgi:hypothetical protein
MLVPFAVTDLFHSAPPSIAPRTLIVCPHHPIPAHPQYRIRAIVFWRGWQ